LGQNPEVRYTPSGAAVANFSVATNESWTDKQGQKQERTEWHRIVVWGKLAELCNQYLSKGRQAYIEGRLQTREWEDKTGVKKFTTRFMRRPCSSWAARPARAPGKAVSSRPANLAVAKLLKTSRLLLRDAAPRTRPGWRTLLHRRRHSILSRLPG